MKHPGKKQLGTSSLWRSIKLTAVFLFFSLMTLPAVANVFNVNTTSDTHAVNPVDGTGLDGSGNVSLRSALEAANAVGGAHTINLPAGVYLLTEGEIYLGDTPQNINIVGAGSASTVIDMDAGANQDRIFFINQTASTTDVQTTISDIKFQNGHLNSDPYGGGAIHAGGPMNVLTINNCFFQNNTLDELNGGTTGAAINMAGGGDLLIDNCTFIGNTNPVSDGGAVYYFLQNFPDLTGSMTVTNSTFGGNSATITGSGSGGAIGFAAAGAAGGQSFSVTIQKNTFINNTAPGGEGGAIIGDNSFGPTGMVNVHYNRFVGNSSSNPTTSGLGMNSADGSIDATNNWWGCNTGPAAAGACNRADVVGFGGGGTLTSAPWLQLKATPSPAAICPAAPGNTSTVTSGFLSNSVGNPIAAADLTALVGLPISFVNPVAGTLSAAQPTIQPSGTATVIFTSDGTPGPGSVNAVVDNVPNNDPVAKATITINTPPSIPNGGQPVDVTTCAGSTATFTVTANGGGTLTYQWFLEENPLSNGPSGTGSAYAGATTATLSITNVSPADNSANYYVVVSNGCGSVVSNHVSLTVTVVTVTNPAVTTGTLGVPFSENFTQSGGVLPVTFSTASSLPPGLMLSSAGVLSGTPSQTGSYPLVVKVTDANLCSGTGDTYTLVISCPSVTVNPVNNQSVCHNSSTAAVNFTGSPAGTVFNWTNNMTSIGLAAMGSGNIPSFTAMNNTNAPVTATITVTPVYTFGSSTCTGAPITFTITVNPKPTFSFDIGGSSVHNTNNGVADPFESATVAVCNGGTYTVSNLMHSTAANRYMVTASGGGLLFDGSPAGNADISAADFNGAQGTHTITLGNPAMGGSVVQVIAPYYDANGSGSFDAGDCQGDPITITYTGYPRPVLQSTLNTITLTNNHDGVDESASMTVCNTPDNLHFSGIIDVQGVTPAGSVKVKQETIKTNVTFNGAVDGVYQIGSFPPAFDRTVALINPFMSGTFVVRRTIFFDINNNNVLDGNECANDGLVYTVTVNPQPQLNTSINGTVVNSVNDGMDDNASFSVCNTPNNIVFNYFVDANGLTGPNVKAYQVIQSTSNVTVPFCSNCSAALTAFAGATGSAALSNPAMTGTLVIKFREFVDNNNNGAIDADECSGDWVVYTITIKPLPACSITGPGTVCPSSTNSYSAASGMTSYSWSITGSGSISGSTTSQVVVVNAGAACNSSYTLTLTITGPNGCSSTCQKTVSVLDNTPPTFTAPADQTIIASSTCSYTLPVANPLLITDEADNCNGAITITSSDAVAQCGNNTVVTRTWKATDACGNSTTHDQIFTVTDNNTPYIIYATSEAKFGEDNSINGDVGVTAANGKAEFKKGDVLDPYHVYAKNITVQMPAMVNNKHFVPATGGPNPPFQMYVAVALTGNYNQTTNGTVPAGNYKELTIKKGVTATVNGSNYGKITIEENANVTFTSSSINMEELNVKKGKDPGTTNVYFTTCTAVRVKDRVTIEENSRVNVGGPKVTFYLGDAKKDEENFSVKGDNSQVTLNIMIPNGKLKVNGGNSNAIMTGWFIIEKLESDGKNVTWNKYGCGPLARGPVVMYTETATKNAPAEEIASAFKVNVYPNPSSSDFRIQVLSPNNEPVMVRIFDLSGKTLQVISNAAKNSFITVGGQLHSGAYYAEVQQGASRQTVKLVKVE